MLHLDLRRLTAARSGMKRSPRTNTSRDDILTWLRRQLSE